VHQPIADLLRQYIWLTSLYEEVALGRDRVINAGATCQIFFRIRREYG
jgi:hypothetical protein